MRSQTLISLGRAQPCLWNNSHRSFKIKDMKTLTWESDGLKLKPQSTGYYCTELTYTIFMVMCSHVSQTNSHARISCFIFFITEGRYSTAMWDFHSGFCLALRSNNWEATVDFLLTATANFAS